MEKKTFPDFHFAKHKILLWTLAILITLASAVYQRMTGPTYPVRGKLSIAGSPVSFKLPRSESGNTDAPLRITARAASITGFVRFKRYNSTDEWSVVPLERSGENLTARLPHQPPAGKIIYDVILQKEGTEISLTSNAFVVLRYKGAVPLFVLIPHVFFIFFAMLLSNRTGLEALDASGNSRKFMFWTIGLFFIGGLILGPLVQKYAFGALWTGIPFGHDLTDNKTLIAMAGWVFAWYKNSGGRRSRGSIFAAALLMLVIYLIPHSVLGSELDYTTMKHAPGVQ